MVSLVHHSVDLEEEVSLVVVIMHTVLRQLDRSTATPQQVCSVPAMSAMWEIPIQEVVLQRQVRFTDPAVEQVQ